MDLGPGRALGLGTVSLGPLALRCLVRLGLVSGRSLPSPCLAASLGFVRVGRLLVGWAWLRRLVAAGPRRGIPPVVRVGSRRPARAPRRHLHPDHRGCRQRQQFSGQTRGVVARQSCRGRRLVLEDRRVCLGKGRYAALDPARHAIPDPTHPGTRAGRPKQVEPRPAAACVVDIGAGSTCSRVGQGECFPFARRNGAAFVRRPEGSNAS